MLDLVVLIPALPLLGFVVLMATGKRMGEPLAGIWATLMVTASFAVGLVVYIGLVTRPESDRIHELILFEWIPAGDFSVDMGFLVDPLSVTWVLFVTGIGALIHLYSIGYMHGDPRYPQYFAYLNLFLFSMLMLVLGNNFMVTFLGWEGVGLCSYLLISFWFEKKENATAGKKAFVTNRIGDWGFLVAMFLTFLTFGSLRYTEVLPEAAGLAAGTATALALLYFVAAVGKSAQLPLFVWLPDAMAGPTPVSALIHAATMVTAGVYLMVRINPILFAADPWVGDLIAWVGVITAFVAATAAVAQNDIKRVLAYSTISQLGFMFLAVGTGAYVAAVFHVVTHAFFKALLFLGSGSVIHGMDGEQDMRRMGALRKWMPITFGAYIVGWLAIAGLPPFAGFWSKDEILVFGADGNWGLFVIGIATAFLTAFYMSRQVFMVFYGEAHWGENASAATSLDSAGEGASRALEDQGTGAEPEASVATAEAGADPLSEPGFKPHESGWLMTLPVVVLAIFSVVMGAINLPFDDDIKFLERWLHPSIPFETHLGLGAGAQWLLAAISIGLAAIAVLAAYIVYLRRTKLAAEFEPRFLEMGWYIDFAYAWVIAVPGTVAFNAVTWFDENVIDGAVNGVGAVTRGIGLSLRRVQTGFVRTYALVVAMGAVVLIGYVVSRMTY